MSETFLCDYCRAAIDEDISGGEAFGALILVAIALASVALIVYGGLQFWQEIAQDWF